LQINKLKVCKFGILHKNTLKYKKKTIIKYPKNKLYKVYNFSFLIYFFVFDVKGYLRNHPIQSYCFVIIVFKVQNITQYQDCGLQCHSNLYAINKIKLANYTLDIKKCNQTKDLITHTYR